MEASSTTCLLLKTRGGRANRSWGSGRRGEHSWLVTVHTSTCITYREVVEMKEIKVINALDIDGKETPFSELTVEDQKQMAGKIRDTVMNFAGYRRKTAWWRLWWTSLREEIKHEIERFAEKVWRWRLCISVRWFQGLLQGRKLRLLWSS